MALFPKKRAEAAPLSTLPVDEVLRMREQGFSNNQIVQALQRNGFKTHQIFDAMNQADLKGAGPIEGAVPEELAEQPPQAEPEEMTQEMTQQQAEKQPDEAYESQIEETAEAIIEEKWEDLMKNINKMLEWKEAMENRIAALEQSQKDIKESFDGLQGGVLGKVAEYDKTMKTVGTDIKAMDAVFQKILPTLAESINEMSRLTKKARKTSTD